MNHVINRYLQTIKTSFESAQKGSTRIGRITDGHTIAPALNNLAHKLAGMSASIYRIYMGKGIIYHGSFTALVSIKLHTRGSIVWHVEVSNDGLLKVNDLCGTKHSMWRNCGFW